jgi:hypothetical protein
MRLITILRFGVVLVSFALVSRGVGQSSGSLSSLGAMAGGGAADHLADKAPPGDPRHPREKEIKADTKSLRVDHSDPRFQTSLLTANVKEIEDVKSPQEVLKSGNSAPSIVKPAEDPNDRFKSKRTEKTGFVLSDGTKAAPSPVASVSPTPTPKPSPTP